MYNTGTVTTTANSTKVTGTNTKWKDNNSLVSAEQVILIQNGTTVYINSIASIQSDTELTLSFAAPAAVKNGTYRILTTMVNSISDAANKLVAMNNANAVFSEVLNRMFTETGIITVVLPDGTTLKTKTFAEMDKQLEGKFDKAGGVITRDGESITIRTTKKTQATIGFRGSDNELRGYIGNPNDSDRFAITNQKTSKSLALTENGKLTYGGIDVMLVGDFGVGSTSSRAVAIDFSNYRFKQGESVYATNASTNLPENLPAGYYRVTGMSGRDSGTEHSLFIFSDSPGGSAFYATSRNNRFIAREFYTTGNTTKDSNGNLKAASPIIRVFADHVDPNEEAKGVTLKKLHTGIYQLHGVLGLHSDASWGGINGGITIPCGINQLPLVYALYDVLEKGKPHPFDGRIVEPDEDGDIVLYTSYRQHDLPQNIQYERFKLYPEFLRDATEGEESIPGFDGKVELTPGEPCDIPRGHWVDVRVNMPSNSIYNQKQAEAERLAKMEAERLAQEEAKRAAEEAERAEQEAAEQVEQQ
ncbi:MULTISPECIES: hypothetical protein [Providencia]|uniref:phage tail fiber protein n=1 Tax=Providencia TaxID=586 RepID=UPI002349CC2A|nr:hypothetical protein [Providencia sp. PROV123]